MQDEIIRGDDTKRERCKAGIEPFVLTEYEGQPLGCLVLALAQATTCDHCQYKRPKTISRPK